MRTIVLLSGGLDSAVVLAALGAARSLALAFDYGQPHRIELERAEAIAHYYATPFEKLLLPALPKVDDAVFAGRNLVFAALAIAKAQAGGLTRIAVGCNATDWPRFPDCRPLFWDALDTCASAYGIQIVTPLLHYTKREIVERARSLKVPIELTWSCYSSGPEPCGECLACKTREDAMQ